MAALKIAISLEENLLKEIDKLVSKKIFPSRSRAIQEAVQDKIMKISKSRLAKESAKLNPEEEIQIAEEGIDYEADEWPEY